MAADAEFRITRNAVMKIFRLSPEDLADLEARRVLEFGADRQIDLTWVAARIYAEGQLMAANARLKAETVSKLAELLRRAAERFWQEIAIPDLTEAKLEAAVARFSKTTNDLAGFAAEAAEMPLGSQPPVETTEAPQ